MLQSLRNCNSSSLSCQQQIFIIHCCGSGMGGLEFLRMYIMLTVMTIYFAHKKPPKNQKTLGPNYIARHMN